MFAVKRKSTLDKLLYDIHVKREEMIHLGLTSGFNSSETIQVSQELDTLIVKYQRYKEKKVSKWFLMIKTSLFKMTHTEKSHANWTTFIK